MKKLLILGNGFDLAHGLPTKYSQFLDFSYDIMQINQAKEGSKANHFNNSSILHNFFNNVDEVESSVVRKLCLMLSNNIWYTYLQEIYKENIMRGENWIDFESEISVIIEFIDRECIDLSNSTHRFLSQYNDKTTMNNYTKIRSFYLTVSNSNWIINNNEINRKLTIRELRKKLNEDLRNLAEALDIYLSEFVLKQPIVVYSPDIRAIQPEYVINFNYTNIYSKIYQSNVNEFHIHGSCRNDVFVGENNIVLGIDEYWSEQERDNHTNFTIFKKFAQRIQRRTGKKHFEIYEKLKSDQYERVCVYVFGHSLDVTDKDILKMFFDDAFVVTIFCRNEETEGEYIANVIKIIGEQKLIERVNQNPPTIIFQKQADMIGKDPDANVKQDCEKEEEPEDELVTAK